MTSQQSRRKSQVSINNHGKQQIDPIQQLGLNGITMQMINAGTFGGMSDTGAPPDSSGSSMNMNPIQSFQTNFTASQLASYNQNMQDKKKMNSKLPLNKNLVALRFNQ